MCYRESQVVHVPVGKDTPMCVRTKLCGESVIGLHARNWVHTIYGIVEELCTCSQQLEGESVALKLCGDLGTLGPEVRAGTAYMCSN